MGLVSEIPDSQAYVDPNGLHILDIIGSCRAMRYLKPDPVPDDLIRMLVWAATRAPSPKNTQPWHFVVVDDRAVIKTIGNDVAAVMAKRAAARTEHPISTSGAHLAASLADVPVLIVVTAGLSYPPEAPEERYVWSAVYPASQNIILAARALGLGAAFTTLHHFAPETFRSNLGIPDEIRIGTVIPVGWPARSFGPVRRKPIDEVISRNHWAAGPAGRPSNYMQAIGER
jgi:nitroreductase